MRPNKNVNENLRDETGVGDKEENVHPSSPRLYL